MKVTYRSVGMAAAASLAAVFVIFMQFGDTPDIEEKPAEPAPNHFTFVRPPEEMRRDGTAHALPGNALLVDARLAELFDRHLSAVGNMSLDAIRLKIGQELDSRLTPQAAAQGKNLLERYIGYQTALVSAEKIGNAAENHSQTLRLRIESLRTQFFTPEEIKGLFGARDVGDAATRSRAEVQANEAFPDQQAKDKLKQHAEQMVRLQGKAEQMRARGASEDDILRMKVEALSPPSVPLTSEVDGDTKN